MYIKFTTVQNNNEVINMNPISELPMGFGMALIQNEKAFHYFGSLSASEQKTIINQTVHIKSRQEMKSFVQSLTDSKQSIT